MSASLHLVPDESERVTIKARFRAAIHRGPYCGFSDPEDWQDPIPALGSDGNILEPHPDLLAAANEAVTRVSASHEAKHGLRHHPWCGHCHMDYAEINKGAKIDWHTRPVMDVEMAATYAAHGIDATLPTRAEDARERLVKRAAAYLAVGREPLDTYDTAEDSDDLSSADMDKANEHARRLHERKTMERELRGSLQTEVKAAESVSNFDRMTEIEIDMQVQKLKIRDEAKRRYEAEKNPDTGTLDADYLTVDQLDSLPTPEPLIDGVLMRHSYSILRGRDGTYKSFVALDWALCMATGKRWQGQDTQPVRVLYVAGEGAFGISARVKAWESAWQTKVGADRFTARTSSVNLRVGGPVFEDLLQRVTDGDYGLVIIDTLRRASGGADENSSEMGTIVDNLERVKRATLDGSVLVIAHTGKADDDTRGFSGIEDDADAVWHTKRDAESGDFTLTNKKMKDGPDGKVYDLFAKPVLGSLIISAGVADPFAGSRPSELKVLNVLADTFALTNGATKAEIVNTTGLSDSGFYKARGELLKRGEIQSTGAGNSTRYSLPEK